MVENTGQKKSRSLTYFSCPRVLFHPRGRRLSFLLFFFFPFLFFFFFSFSRTRGFDEGKEKRKKEGKKNCHWKFLLRSLPPLQNGRPFRNVVSRVSSFFFPPPPPLPPKCISSTSPYRTCLLDSFFFPSSIFTPSSPLPPSNLSINPRLNPADVWKGRGGSRPWKCPRNANEGRGGGGK